MCIRDRIYKNKKEQDLEDFASRVRFFSKHEAERKAFMSEQSSPSCMPRAISLEHARLINQSSQPELYAKAESRNKTKGMKGK